MRISEKYYDEVFEFEGLWGMPSRCGLRILNDNGRTTVVVTELYRENPGTSITSAGRSLAEQICKAHGLALSAVRYIECNPDMNSKLSFYDEAFFEVSFDDGSPPFYRRLEKNEPEVIFGNALRNDILPVEKPETKES